MAVHEKEREVYRGEQEEAGVEHDRSEPFPQDDFNVAHRRGCEQLDRSSSFFFGEEAHGDQRNEKEPDHSDVGEQWPNDPLIQVHRKGLAAHLRLDALENESPELVPEEEAKDQPEHDEQDVSDRRCEIAAQFLATDNPDISHQACTSTGVSSGVDASVPVSCRNTSSRLMADGRSSFRSQPDCTMARARSPRINSFLLSTSKTARASICSLQRTRLTPGICSSFCRTSEGSKLPARPATSTSTDSAPRARACRLRTESVATSFPLLMMITCSQVCSTSGRMCVLRMMVCSPARSLIKSRVSLICLGSSPAVGSSRMRTSGLWMMAWASPTRWR